MVREYVAYPTCQLGRPYPAVNMQYLHVHLTSHERQRCPRATVRRDKPLRLQCMGTVSARHASGAGAIQTLKRRRMERDLQVNTRNENIMIQIVAVQACFISSSYRAHLSSSVSNTPFKRISSPPFRACLLASISAHHHPKTADLSRRLKRLWEAAEVVRDRALVAEELNVGTVDTDLASLALLDVLGAVERSETPLLGDDDLLAAGELVLGASESLDGGGAV
jgi:hypothetical protein